MADNRRSVEFWLNQIVVWCERIDDYVKGRSVEEFASRQESIDAVSWCITCIGEACGRILDIDPAYEKLHPDLSLGAAHTARNRYVHGYFDLDVQQVWDTSVDAVPRLAAEARRILDGGR